MNNQEFEPNNQQNNNPVDPNQQAVNPQMYQQNQGQNPNMNGGFNINFNGGFNPNSHLPKKSKICAGLLAIFIGTLGIHNFYLGYNGKGLAQLLLSLLTCGLCAPIVAIWALIEGIMILTSSTYVDANGNRLDG